MNGQIGELIMLAKVNITLLDIQTIILEARNKLKEEAITLREIAVNIETETNPPLPCCRLLYAMSDRLEKM